MGVLEPTAWAHCWADIFRELRIIVVFVAWVVDVLIDAVALCIRNRAAALRQRTLSGALGKLPLAGN